MPAAAVSARVGPAAVSAYEIPTDFPEADGTYAWSKTTLVVVELPAGGARGFGYTYANTAAAEFIRAKLAHIVEGRDPMDVPGAWAAMQRAVRNDGRPGIVSSAIAAVDAALWDLKARLLDLPLAKLLGLAHEGGVAAYGSGGFTSYPIDRLQAQLRGWAEDGLPAVKMKVGTDPEQDFERARQARAAIGPSVHLYVDANGAYSRKQALEFAARYSEIGVSWFEEPVSSDDLEGLRLIRDQGPPGMDIAAGEYGYDLFYFRRMLEAGAVDVLQADATRCGPTAFLGVASLCAARSLLLSAHTAPSLHAHLCCALEPAWNIEYFHDHARIERMLFDGARIPERGRLRPDLSRPGLGLELKRADAARFQVS